MRVRELVNAMVASRVAATATVGAQEDAVVGTVEHVATLIESSDPRVAGRFGRAAEI